MKAGLDRGRRLAQGPTEASPRRRARPGSPAKKLLRVVASPREQRRGRHEVAGLHDRPVLEVRRHRGQVRPRHPLAERGRRGQPQQVADDLELAALLAHLELDLAAQRRQHVGEVADPGDRVVLTGPAPHVAARTPTMASARRDGEPGRDARALVDRGRGPALP